MISNTPISHAIILLAGTGSRLRPLTNNTHKSLLKVGNQTFLERLLLQLSQNGIQHFHLALGYRGHDIQTYVATRFPELRVSFYENPQFETTNNAFSLQLVLNQLDEGFILLDGDIMMSDDLVTHFMQQTHQSFIVCDTRKDRLNEEAMKCIVNENHHVLNLNKKISVAEAYGESIGVACLQNEWSKALQKSLAVHMSDSHKKRTWYYEDVFVDLINTKNSPPPLLTLSSKLPWIEVDNVKDFEEAQKLFGTK